MTLFNLVGLKPDSIILLKVKEVRGIDSISPQELCVKIKAISFVPSRDDCKLIRIYFEPMEISSDCEVSEASKLTIKEAPPDCEHDLTITGCLRAVDGGEEFFTDITYSAIDFYR